MGQAVGGLTVDERDAVVSRLREAPVRLALLFGSRARSGGVPGSDVDIAVAYDETVNDETATHLSLVADLTRALGRDDVDVVSLARVDPRIAVAALEEGELLVGTRPAAEAFREDLEAAREHREREVQSRVADAERAIERRLERRDDG